MDFTSFLVNVAKLEPGSLAARNGERRTVTYHDSCQGLNALGLGPEPRFLIEEVMGDDAEGRGRFRSGATTGLEIGTDLDADAAREACEEIAGLLADHPDAEGSAELTLHVTGDLDEVLVRNEVVEPGDPGACTTP